MKNIIFIISHWFPIITYSQGINFIDTLSWNQVKEKAFVENKYIFVDCYATWCGPCKYMDRNIYTKDSVGNYLNINFISIRLQMDTSQKDNEIITSRYNDAHLIQQEFSVFQFPTYLFYSPSGEILHKGLGLLDQNGFITLVKNSLSPNEQYYTLLNEYKEGRLDYKMMPKLLKITKQFSEKELSKSIANDYINNYLSKCGEQELFNKENIKFVSSNSSVLNSKDTIFKMFYKKASLIDSIMNIKGYAQTTCDVIIRREEIDENLINGDKFHNYRPEWNVWRAKIKSKYNETVADRIIINAQIQWYTYKEDWKRSAQYNIKKIEKFGIDTSGIGKLFLNNMIWDVIFLHIDDPVIINKSIRWMKILVDANYDDPGTLDTYANLLYKAGRLEQALIWETKAKNVDEEKSLRQKTKPNKVYNETLSKMRIGQPTWIQ